MAAWRPPFFAPKRLRPTQTQRPTFVRSEHPFSLRRITPVGDSFHNCSGSADHRQTARPSGKQLLRSEANFHAGFIRRLTSLKAAPQFAQESDFRGALLQLLDP